MKSIKRIGFGFLFFCVIFVLCTTIYHNLSLMQGIKMLKQNGYYNPVSVGDYSLNVSKFGDENGEHKIIALAGNQSGSYSVGQRHMTRILEEDNLVVFIDRAGYGFSDDTKNKMSLEYIVEDYRKALTENKTQV